MKNLASLSPVFNIVKEGNQKREFLNLKMTTRDPGTTAGVFSNPVT